MLIRVPPDTHTFANAAEMRAHYAAVHKRIYGDITKEAPKPTKIIGKKISVDSVMTITSVFYRVPIQDILIGRNPLLIRIRYIAMYLSYHVARKPMRHIGKVMGYQINTVFEGVRKIKERRVRDAILNSELNVLTRRIEE